MDYCPKCGAELADDALEGLCESCLLAGGFEATLTSGEAPEQDDPTALESNAFGPYQILRVLGEGGMGTVYLAQQTQPIRRQVALKVIKPGIDTRQILARFENERQALALMNHPNIASVYDAGTDNDRPYFVMEYIDGVPISEYCDIHRLSTKERLELFIPVCHAVLHAHQKGVIHRDIKPSNVMVMEKDGRPIPKVIDFGIARAIDQRALESQMFTNFGQFVGTPEYISPEQADVVTNDIDTTSDVYSLGVLLYELLVGTLPFPLAKLREAGLAELLRIIREEEAPTLLSKLTEMGENATAVAERRRTDPASLRRQLMGDLNWIVLKAVEKDRHRRYLSVSDLAADILRYLEDQPVQASPPSRVYRARKFVRRHRTAVLTLWLWSTVVVLVLAASLYLRWLVLKTPVPTFDQLTYRRGYVLAARFSPDGQTVVFSAQWPHEPMTIFSMRPGSRESRPLDLPAGRILSVSSTGEMAVLLGTHAAPGNLARVPLSGGVPSEILENVNDADWSPDGTKLAVSHTVAGKNRIEYPIGTVLYESVGFPPLSLHVAPKGDQLAFFEYDNAVGDFAVTLLDLHGNKRVLSRGWRGEGNLAWSPKGDEIWFGADRAGANAALHAVSLKGNERSLVETSTLMALDDVTRDGRILTESTDSRVGISALPPGETQERDLSWFDASRIWDISSDGKTILFVELRYGQQRNFAIYVRKTDGSPAVHLGDGNRPALSPDGKWVACIVSDGTRTKLTLLPTGAGEARSIGATEMHYERVEWFPDGQRLLFTGNEPNRPPRTFIQDLQGGKPVSITREGTVATAISPDQKYATMVRAGKLTLTPIAGGEPREVAWVEAGQSVVRWSGDGQSLFLKKLEEPAFLKISRLDIATGRQQLWRELKTPDPVGVNIREVMMTPDGASYAYSFVRDIATLFLVGGLR
jgi:serine/threonine protein kinase/Tol biopolymer transport system component